MTYKKLITDPMPEYSKGEEIFNYVSHIVCGSIGIFMVVFSSICFGVKNLNLSEYLSVLTYSITIILLYTISTLYHALSKKLIAKRIFRILDHCTIYLLIAGTYTPICIIAFNETIFGYIVLAIEWIGAIIGILLKVKDLNNKFIKVITMLLYIIMGWCLMIFPFLIQYLSIYQFIMILGGGILYTIGIVFFIVGAKKKWFHSIFHIFCCLGTVVQMFAIIDMFLF